MKYILHVFALLALAAASARAELNFPAVVLDDAFVAYERDVGDIDGDGLNDVVATSDGGTAIEWFRAPGWTRQTLVTLTGTYRFTRADDFKVADVDGDLDADLIVRLGAGAADDGEGRAAWIENLGAGTNWAVRLVGISPSYGKDIAVGDLDRDGRLDLVYREDALTQIWFQETNGWTEVALSHADHEGLELGDLDMDGDLDVVLNGFWFATPDTPAACRVDGNYAQATIDSQWFTQSGDWTANSCKVAVGDLDGDGTNDVVLSQSERAGHDVTWYKRSGASWTARSIAAIDYAHNLQAYDADLDGDTDILTGGMPQSSQRGLRLYLNDGTGTNWTIFPLRADGSYSAELGDIDNDGDLDIVGIVNWNSAPSYILRSNAGGPPSLDFWHYIRASDAHVRTFGLAFADVDGDGDADIASGPYLYRNPGGVLTGAWAQTTLAAGRHVFLAANVDDDNRADWLALQDNGADNRIDLYWHEAGDAAGTNWAEVVRFGDVPRSEHAEGFQGSRLGQIEAGGRPEVLISSGQGIYYFAIPAAPATGAWPRVFVTANDSDEGLGVADFDADGDLDIAFASGNSKNVMWARNPGDGSPDWTVFTLGTFSEADWIDRCEAVDLNGDGRADVVATEENAGGAPDALAVWWEQPATSPTNGGWTRRTIATRYTLNSMDAADVDHDGDTDLVLAEHRGDKRISVFANDGAGAFAEYPVGAGEENHLGARLADLDGDGDLDLAGIAYDTSTRLHVWRNDSPGGTPTVARPAIAPNGGVFDEPVPVTLSCATAGAEIWYTLDGSAPTNAAPALAYSNEAFSVTTTTTVKARGFKTGFTPGPVATATFTGPQVRAPVIAPAGGVFVDSIMVSITCATTGAVVHLTLDGSAPDEAAPPYPGAFELTNSATVRARAYRDGLAPGAEASAVFTRLAEPGAVAHWRFDERFGATAYDSSGQGRTGTVVGAARATGRFDQALTFDGSDDRVEAGTWNVAGTGLTLCAWMRLAGPYADNDARLVSKAVGSAEQDHAWMLSLTGGAPDIRLRFRLKTGGTTTTLIAGGGTVHTGAWHHAAAVYNGTTMRLYLDGTNVGETAKSGEIASSSAAIFVGANPPAAYAPFAGELDDVRIYNLALTGDEIIAVRSGPAAPAAPTLLAPDGAVNQLQLTGSPGHYLILQRSPALVDPAWTDVSTQAIVDTTPVLVPVELDTEPFSYFRTRED